MGAIDWCPFFFEIDLSFNRTHPKYKSTGSIQGSSSGKRQGGVPVIAVNLRIDVGLGSNAGLT
jgi:hypothetical protein